MNPQIERDAILNVLRSQNLPDHMEDGPTVILVEQGEDTTLLQITKHGDTIIVKMGEDFEKIIEIDVHEI